MKGPKLWIVLAASAIAVGFQNYVFFSGLDDGPRSFLGEFDEEFEDEDGEYQEAMDPIGDVRLATWIETLPTPGRSPVLPQTEADALGGEVMTARPRLSGTLWSPDRRVAWIGGHPHSEGDWVGEHWVERIEPSGVVLRQGENRLHLRAPTNVDEPDEESNDEK